MQSNNPFRLPRSVVPTRYQLAITTDLEAETFTGTVVVDLEVTEPVRELICNAIDLSIHEAVVRVGEQRYPLSTEYVHAEERVRFVAEVELPAGEAVLEVRYSGECNQKLVGYYAANYTDNGEDKRLGVTQFEAPHARRAFPCWDEPDFKAVFDVELTCASGIIAVSNSPERMRRDNADGTVTFSFEPTMLMSTYLVAWVIGELELSEPSASGQTPIRVAARPGQGHLTAFALHCATHALQWFEEYYGIPYPAAKLDLVAVPDFAFGAMENLGCVTFRENLLLVDPESASRTELERVATVIEHEIAHMWFGDLVTMAWWNGIWLNEAFATFMELSCADAYRPDWEMWTSFGLLRTQAFETDALAATRPIEYRVDTPDDAEAMFDILTYEKGASVLRMFEQWAGPERFRSGIGAYLRAHSYSNTETADLWTSLSEATNTDVVAIMDSWINQGGHPLITASPTPHGVLLHQTRFRNLNGSAPDATWQVPIRIRAEVDGTTVRRSVLHSGEPLAVDLGGTPTQVTINEEASGFYRSEYQSPWATSVLTTAPESSPAEQIGILDDLWALFSAGRSSIEPLAVLLRGLLTAEASPLVWRRASGILGQLVALTPIDHVGLQHYWRDLAQELAVPTWKTLEPTSEPSHAQQEVRALSIALAGTVGAYGPARQEAARLFALQTTSARHSTGDPELDAAVLHIVAADALSGAFEELLSRFRTASTPQEELRALNALAEFDTPEAQQAFCELCRVEVRSQNAPYGLAHALALPTAGPAVWTFITTHWDELCGRFPSSSIPRMIGGIRSFADADQVGVVTDFLRLQFPSPSRVIEQHLESAQANVGVSAYLVSEFEKLSASSAVVEQPRNPDASATGDPDA